MDNVNEYNNFLIKPPSDLKLHEAVIYVLQQAGQGLNLTEIERRIREQNLYHYKISRKDAPITQINSRVSAGAYQDVFSKTDTGTILHKPIGSSRLMRLTWNDQGWTRPVKHEWKASNQGKSNVAFENQFGFGFEEWLFNSAFNVDGYQYGLIRGAERMKNRHTIVKEIHLYTINQTTGKRYYAGQIDNVELISVFSQQSQVARQLYVHHRELMENNIETVGGDIKGLQTFNYPCIRFKMEDVTLFDPIVEAELLQSDSFKRFSPMELDTLLSNYLNEITPTSLNFKKGSRTLSDSYQRTITAGTITIKRLHDTILTSLEAFLHSASSPIKGVVGIDNNTFGKNRADIVIKHESLGYSIIEVKTSYNLRRNIREALGQLLDYACWFSDTNVTRLIIVSPAELHGKKLAFFNQMKKQILTPVSYWQYIESDNSFKIIVD
jgi:hypothetical protein